MTAQRKLFSLDSLAMYTLTMIAEVPLILSRALVMFLDRLRKAAHEDVSGPTLQLAG
jgi:hypothetical protein